MRKFIYMGLFNSLIRRFSVYSTNVENYCFKTSKYFYWVMAFIFSIALVADSFLEVIMSGPEGDSYDFVIKHRISSPKASSEIVILDIDEKSLSDLSSKYGRWPWPRSVLAEALASLEDEGAKSILFNILITDPDVSNKDADSVLDNISNSTQKTAYPFVRLSMVNDKLSKLKVEDINGVVPIDSVRSKKNIAVLLPFFSGMRNSMGISNLSPDTDGIIRKYDYVYQEVGWSMPSIIKKTLDLSGFEDINKKNSFYINWRNKRNSYERISFSDYYSFLQGDNVNFKYTFKNKYIILGVSAPGLANLKATSAFASTDDNFILANALDDTINGTYLRVIPTWFLLLISCSMLIAIAHSFSKDISSKRSDVKFITLQALASLIMFVSVSYTHFYLDLTTTITYGIAFFTVAKTHALLSSRALYGTQNHLESILGKSIRTFGTITFNQTDITGKSKRQLLNALVKSFGKKNVFLCEDLFDEGSLLSQLNKVGCFLVFKEELSVENFDNTAKDFPYINCKIFQSETNEKNTLKLRITKSVINSIVEHE